MSTIEFAQELNQPRHGFSNTGAMTAKAAELAFVRRAVASSVLGPARALVLSGLLAGCHGFLDEALHFLVENVFHAGKRVLRARGPVRVIGV